MTTVGFAPSLHPRLLYFLSQFDSDRREMMGEGEEKERGRERKEREKEKEVGENEMRRSHVSDKKIES